MVKHRRTNPLLFLLAAVIAAGGIFWQQRSENVEAATRAEAVSHAEAKWTRVHEVVPARERAALLETLARIERGGPFPYAKDGVTFANREGRLPAHPRGYYREYTVPTPGAKNRGARRVVQGRGGDTWYTSDHYKSFVRIDE